MLSRRNLRVKVMQTLYAMEHSNHATPAEAMKMLEKSIEKSYKLLVFNLTLFVRMADHISREADLKSSKLLPTQDDLKFSTKLTRNQYIKLFRNDKRVADRLKLIMTDEEATMVKDLFKKLAEEADYKRYCDTPDDHASDKEMILFILSSVILKNAAYLQYVEDNFPECLSELNKVGFAITELLEKASSGDGSRPLEFGDSEAEVEFARHLLDKTIANNEAYTALIQPKLKNWDVDRIARLDMILMKMALSELLNFEQIPVKVSINEYIDISKHYSTPKSKDFINGILDNIMHELRGKNEIKKTGRGLVE